jgi:hypothetical protein
MTIDESHGISFVKLNGDWNAEPNAPEPEVEQSADTVILRFYLNPWLFPQFSDEDVGALRFTGCSGWRLGRTNDEGWYMGQCRYSRIAPAWGEFYEILGDDPRRNAMNDWHQIGPALNAERHFLFYLRDETFECVATNWSFSRDQVDTLRRAGVAKVRREIR